MTDNIYAKIIADSISVDGNRLTTMECRFHRYVLSEFNTHRKFSRNSASSRAIPVQKILDRVIDTPAFPVSYPEEQSGMQGGEDLSGQDLQDALSLIDELHNFTTNSIQDYVDSHPDTFMRLHKSILNRYLEPFMFHTVIVSSTEWDNFFNQRCSPLAQPEIKLVAEAMRDALKTSIPVTLDCKDWHMPYVLEDEARIIRECQYESNADLHVSAARCARVSYLTHDGTREIEKDLELYKRLVTANPRHESPLEHVARPATTMSPGNFTGFSQLRHMEDYQ